MGRVYKVLIPRRVWEFIEGSDAYVEAILRDTPSTWQHNEPIRQLIQHTLHCKPRKDGSILVPLWANEKEALRECAKLLATVAWQPGMTHDDTADLNAARACLRRISAAEDVTRT